MARHTGFASDLEMPLVGASLANLLSRTGPTVFYSSETVWPVAVLYFVSICCILCKDTYIYIPESMCSSHEGNIFGLNDNPSSWFSYHRDSHYCTCVAFLPPTPPVAKAKTHYSLCLTWHDALEDVNHDVDQKAFFELHMCPLTTTTVATTTTTMTMDDPHHDPQSHSPIMSWQVVECHCITRECTISNLSALSWYCFRVRAWIRQHGWTEFSDVSAPIQTCRRM